jgi:hypothetical protein
MTVSFLLVTCCLEQSRADILTNVIANLQEQAPELRETLAVFDNASTAPGVVDVLRDCFTHVYRADRNVGYWSAIDWWLDRLAEDPPAYTYIIESDMVHYAFSLLEDRCVPFLDGHPELGAMRLHQYSIEHMNLYNKDSPVPQSRRNLWQSHTNRVTGQPVRHELVEAPFWKTNFLTQLPALNRYPTMKRAFGGLRASDRFTEVDFQRLCHDEYPEIAILDGGIFHCDLNPCGSKTVTGSWTRPEDLKRLGYQPTRLGSITPRDQYTVRRV